MNKANLKISIYRSPSLKTKKKGRLETFLVPYRTGMTILDALVYIHQHLDPSLAFRYECRSGICGTCGMMLNGMPVLSCTTQLSYVPGGYVLEPLANFPVERDLIVNIMPILERYNKIKPYLDTYREVVITKAKANESKPFRRCIECGCCIAGSPTVSQAREETLDPMALVKIARFLTDPRDMSDRHRAIRQGSVSSYSSTEGRRLSRVCPRGVPIDRAIALVKRGGA